MRQKTLSLKTLKFAYALNSAVTRAAPYRFARDHERNGIYIFRLNFGVFNNAISL